MLDTARKRRPPRTAMGVGADGGALLFRCSGVVHLCHGVVICAISSAEGISDRNRKEGKERALNHRFSTFREGASTRSISLSACVCVSFSLRQLRMLCLRPHDRCGSRRTPQAHASSCVQPFSPSSRPPFLPSCLAFRFWWRCWLGAPLSARRHNTLHSPPTSIVIFGFFRPSLPSASVYGTQLRSAAFAFLHGLR